MKLDVELAHDLRAPLQLIYSSAQMLRQTLGEPASDAQGYIDMLMASVNQMRRMLDGAVQSAAPARWAEPVRLVNGDLVACVRELCLRCRPFAEQNGVRLSCGGNVAALSMALDEDRLSRILLNLISNALRFTPRGGGVHVEWRATGDFAEVTVSDTGAGIPADRLPYVFLRGETDGGSGYGLAIARRLARELDGELTARSAPGLGSTFTLRLPVRAARAG